MSVFDRNSFSDPPKQFRPLQLVHVLDRELSLDIETWEENRAVLDRDGIDRRLERLTELGVGGIVANVGFENYLQSAEQWDIFRYGVNKAAELGLVLWLYDEKGYPSGTTGGIVTRAHPEYAALGLACYRVQIQGPHEVRFDLPVSCRKLVWVGATQDLRTATHQTVLDLSGHVDDWGTLRWSAPTGTWTVLFLAERFMYEGTHGTTNVSEFRRYINLLNPNAVRAFLRVTHQQYHRELPPYLWAKIDAVFADEPSLMTAYLPAVPERFKGRVPALDSPLFSDRPPALPWVESFPEQFREQKGYDILPTLFALFFSEAEQAQYVRQDYWEVVAGIYARSFYGQVRTWCREHGTASTGHLFAEENLTNHVPYHGSLFSAVRQMDVPGIDMLNANPSSIVSGIGFITPKQVSSIGHLSEARQIQSESSDWGQRNRGRHASLAERIGQGGVQYALGINQITSYYSWGEVGEAGWRTYNDYMGRLASLLTGGHHVCDIAVLYPVRTMWAHYLPPLQPPAESGERQPLRSAWMERVNAGYPDLVQRLLRQQLDVDILDEQALVEAESRDGSLRIAGESYRAIVLPPMHALSLPAARALAAFCHAGGHLLSAGPPPDLAESPEATARLRAEMAALFGHGGPARTVSAEEAPTLLRALIGADLTLQRPNDNLLYTHRQLEGRDLYFLVNSAPEATIVRPTLRVPGPYTLYRPLAGTIGELGNELEITLDGYEGVFVVCERKV